MKKNYLIIGGSSGIGKEIVNHLSATDNNIIATYNKNETKPDRDNIDYYHLDIMDEDLDIEFLPDSLDGIAYCPGSINLLPFKRFKPQDYTDDFNLQVVGAIKVLQASLKSLKKSGNASIVLFSTVAVQTGFNFHSQVATSKGAIEGLARSLAAELAPDIRVNVIAPSITDTPMASKYLGNEDRIEANAKRHPLNKIGSPSDIAAMASFLLSDKSAWITGQVLHVDGGISSLRV